MSESHTATVETLTAQVRVLMVGSRQVTASVARQLDVVNDPALVSIFGRVKLSSEYAIGSNIEGELVLTGACPFGLGNRTEQITMKREKLDEPFVYVCEGCGREYKKGGGSITGYVHLKATMWNCCNHAQGDCYCLKVSDCPYGRVWFRALPLIVLAGLR